MFGKYEELKFAIQDLRGDLNAGLRAIIDELRKGGVNEVEPKKRKRSHQVRPLETRLRIRESVKKAIFEGDAMGRPYTIRDICAMTGFDYKTVANYINLLEQQGVITHDMVKRGTQGQRKQMHIIPENTRLI